MKNVVALIAAFVALALLVTYWKWLVAAAMLGLIVWGGYLAIATLAYRRRDRLNGVRARNSALAARAQMQHEQYLAGDERGLYGTYRPAPLD